MGRLKRGLRKHRGRRLLAWPAFACVALTVALATVPVSQAQEARRDQLWQFIDDVLLNYRLAEAEEVVRRWTRRPVVSLFSETVEDDALVDSVINEINSALVDTVGEVDYIGMERQSPNILIFISPREHFDLIGRNFGYDDAASLENPLLTDGYTLAWDSDSHEMIFAVAVIAAEIDGDRRRAAVLRELLRTLGAYGNSPVIRNSAFFARSPELSTATAPAPVDRRLIRFLYQHLKPGDTWVSVQDAFEQHWSE